MTKTHKESSDYTLQLSGQGVSVNRTVSESVARQIMNLLMATSSAPTAQPASAEAIHVPDADGSISPKAFLASKKPLYDVERMACLAYYLANYRQTPHFKTRDLTLLNVEAAQPPFSNAAVSAKNAAKYRFLGSVGGGKKQLVARGEAIVNALPDRDKVSAVMADTSLKGSRRAKRSKKHSGKSGGTVQ